MPEFDLAAIYRVAREQLVELAPGLDAGQLATPVPTCPGWAVQDVYAHLSGLAADAIGGTSGWLGSDTNTARQVASRSGRSITEICEEWSARGAAMDDHIATHNLAAISIDAWTHRQDILNALGMTQGRDGAGLELTMSSVWRLKRQFREQGMAGLRIVSGNHDWMICDGEPAATLRIAPYELARAALGRRSRTQMLAYDWAGDPEPFVEMLPVFDPPEHDVIE